MILYELCPWFAGLPLVEKDLAERGALVLFALAQPEESNNWNVLVSAPWLTSDRMNGRTIVVETLHRRLGPEGFAHVSRVLIEPESQLMRFLKCKLGDEAASIEVLGMLPDGIRHLFVLRWSLSAATQGAGVEPSQERKAKAG